MNVTNQKTVLLDICCANCATICIERLKEQGYKVLGFFTNDNIHPKEEYEKRKDAAISIAQKCDIEIFYPEYKPDDWFEFIKGFEHEPERGKRCSKCFEYRLLKTFKFMRDNGHDLFTTTLTISPHKRAKVIHDIGTMIGEETFLAIDFKKKSGYQLSLQRSNEYGLYRQNYCGCVFSKQERELGIEKSIQINKIRKERHRTKILDKRNIKELQQNISEAFLYNSFSEYLNKEFSCSVHRLSISAGFTCPNIDGTISKDGCIFCDNSSFSSFVGTEYSIKQQIERMIESTQRRFGTKKFIAYFQSHTNTYASVQDLKKIYDVIRGYKDIVGLAISTRPDCIDELKLDMIAEYTKDYEVYIEYGLQSVHEKSLTWMNRGHDFGVFKNAVKLTVDRGIKAAAHVILGLPGETKGDMLSTAYEIAKLPLWGVKLHALHIVKSTQLADVYASKPFDLLSEDEYVEIVADFLERIPKEMIALRLVSDADKNYLLAPQWLNNKQKVIRHLEQYMYENSKSQGRLYNGQEKKKKL